MQHDVFISYSRRDYLDEKGNVKPGNIISKIKDVLKKNGITYWIDEDGINSGDEFARLIIKSIKDSKVFLFVSTENSNLSEWTRKEVASAISYKKKIIPFKYDDTPYNDSLLLYLADLDFISYSKGDRALTRLVTSISKYLDGLKQAEETAKASEVAVVKPQHTEPVKKEPKEKPHKKKNVWLIPLIAVAVICALVVTWISTGSDSDKQEAVENVEIVEAKPEEKIEIKAAAPVQEESKPVEKPAPKPVEKKELENTTVNVKGVNVDMIAVKGNGKVGDFLIAKYEVTQGLWKAVMGNTISQQRDQLDPSFKLRGEGDNMPMYYVNWDDCQAFIKKLNSLTGKKFRLPSEAEWEYAAKGGANGDGVLSGWNEENSNGSTHAVGGKEPNDLGLYDMAGNVSEWCKDKRGYEYVVKGGGWASTKDNCKVTSRSYLDEMIRSDETGFRLVMD